MNAYIYQAEVYCPECARAIRRELRSRGEAPHNTRDQHTYDSHSWPKGPFEDGAGKSDSPQHCGAGPKCLNAIEFGGVKVGAFLENPLTFDGLDYVREALKEGGSVAEFWGQMYAEELV